MKAQNIIEVSFDLDDRNLYFAPAGMNVRGKKDYLRIVKKNPSVECVQLANEFPRGVPGTILRVNLDDNTVTLVEPLRTPEYEPEFRKIHERGIDVPYDVTLTHQHLPDWLHEIKRSLDNGYAKIESGKLPDDLGEETTRVEPASKSDDRIDRLCDLFERMAELLLEQRLTASAK